MRKYRRGARSGARIGNRCGRKGASVLEATLLCPWIFFIFVGAFDVGVYVNALISTENAVRAAGMYYVSSERGSVDVAKACYYALEILRAQPNVRSGVSTCAASATAVNQSAPVALTASSAASGPDGQPMTTVAVTYQTVPLIPIPLLLTRQLTVTRAVELKE